VKKIAETRVMIGRRKERVPSISV